MKSETKKNQAPKNESAAPKAGKPQGAPEAESKPEAVATPEKAKAEKPQAPEAVQALWKKAQAAKAAAEAGLFPEEKATALWAEAEAASKPTPEALEAAEKAKAEKAKAEKKESAAKAAFEAGLLEEAVFKGAEAEAEKARAAYKEAAQAAKGFGPGSGGRCKGQMSGLDAAVQVLLESSEALQVGKICEKALEKGLWAPEGQTPAATLSAAIQRELKKGEKSRIVKVPNTKGLFVARKPESEKAEATPESAAPKA